jgi:predicted nucleotidyltransferase
MWTDDGVEMDLVTHDLAKFCRLLLRRNGYVLEQLLSPLVVTSGAVHADLVALAPHCLTRHHAHHYRGFAQTQRRLFAGSGELKPLLYTYRVLLTGIALLRTGRVEAHLPTLGSLVPEAPGYLAMLIDAKASGEHRSLVSVPDAPDADRIGTDLDRLFAVLDEAGEGSTLPEQPSAQPALHDLVVRTRLGA